MRRVWISVLIMVAILITACGRAVPTAAPTATPQQTEPVVTETPTEEATAEAPVEDQISIAGSTTVQPVAEKLGEIFGELTGVKVDVAGGGSSAGVKAAGDGTADIGNASREIKSSELETYPDLVIFMIAKDGIAIVAHPEGTVDELTKDQVREIFAGNITDWSEVGGAAAPITVISREEGSGTRGAFQEMVMGKDGPAITDSAIFQDSNGKVRTAVASTPNSIAFLSFGYLDSSVLAISVDNVEPTVENAINGTYAVVRPLNMVTLGEPAGTVKDFLDWVFTPEGQTIVVDQGFIAVQ